MSNLIEKASYLAATINTRNLSRDAVRVIRRLPTTEAQQRAIYWANVPKCVLCGRVSENQWCGPCGEREYSRGR